MLFTYNGFLAVLAHTTRIAENRDTLAMYTQSGWGISSLFSLYLSPSPPRSLSGFVMLLLLPFPPLLLADADRSDDDETTAANARYAHSLAFCNGRLLREAPPSCCRSFAKL